MAEIYHVLNRGVEKRRIYLDDQDRARFVHDMFEFNDAAPAGNAYRRFTPMMEIGSPSLKQREPLVAIHAWCLMGNHYHILLSDITEGGVARFMRKLNVGYAMYFNEKYGRSGSLFQGKTKRISIDSQTHFLHMLHYIHLNPLDFSADHENWRSGSIQDPKAALKILESYRWSSYLDYCNVRNFPSLLDRHLYADTYPDYRNAVTRHLSDMNLAQVKHLLLE